LTNVHEEYMHPRGGYGMVFNFGDQLTLDAQPLPDLICLDGSNTRSRKMGFRGEVEVLGVTFWVGGAYPFLGIPLAELQNEVALLDALHRRPLMNLYARLLTTPNLAVRIHLLETWLLQRLGQGKDRDTLIPASLARLNQAQGQLAIATLADQFAISQRQLERLYHHQVGVSPKQYAQLLRVEKARLSLKQPQHQTNTQLAMELGFYDQAHFIREFSAVIGMTPYRYMQRGKKRDAGTVNLSLPT
jgi:AraC-like DNA-binding protein